MILCTINGHTAYPMAASKIKVTYCNPYVEDSGSYTYDISFPMSIHQNRTLFGNIHRFDVHKRTAAFDDCRLYAADRLLISGKGTVTAVTEAEVKLQVVGGKSRIKYNSRFESHFIDEIDYPDIVVDYGIDRSRYAGLGLSAVKASDNPPLILVDLRTDCYVGQKGVAAFYTVNDETYDSTSNTFYAINGEISFSGAYRVSGKIAFISNLAVQPNLLHVLSCVLQAEGYTVRRNDLDRQPLTRLFIASARRTLLVRQALPHWSVYTFIEEVRKLFNVTFLFDDASRSVDIVDADELTSASAVAYDCLDEYSSEFDDDGLSVLATSNLAYSFDSSPNRSWREDMPVAVMQNYPVRTFPDIDSLKAAARAMDVRERRQTIFRIGDTYYIYALLSADGDPDSDNLTEQLAVCGLFHPLVRTSSTADAEQLRIIPVAMFQRQLYTRAQSVGLIRNVTVVMPSVSNDADSPHDDMSQDSDGYFVSVQDAIQGTDSAAASAEDTSSSMHLMFQGTHHRDLIGNQTWAWGNVPSADRLAIYPIALTDSRMFPEWTGTTEDVSLSLTRLHAKAVPPDIDNHNLFCIRFLTDDIPDPSKIYIFRNRRFICQKVELEVSEDGVSRLKTGYFYEIL